MFEIPYSGEICRVCGWQDDGLHKRPDYYGGPNRMTFNEYKSVWESNRQAIIDFKKVGGKERFAMSLYLDGLSDDARKEFTAREEAYWAKLKAQAPFGFGVEEAFELSPYDEEKMNVNPNPPAMLGRIE